MTQRRRIATSFPLTVAGRRGENAPAAKASGRQVATATTGSAAMDTDNQLDARTSPVVQNAGGQGEERAEERPRGSEEDGAV